MINQLDRDFMYLMLSLKRQNMNIRRTLYRQSKRNPVTGNFLRESATELHHYLYTNGLTKVQPTVR